MSMSENILIAGEYTWIRLEGDYAVVGLNEYILYDHREVCSVELPEPGEELDVDGHFCSVETLDGYIEVYAPVSGQVVEINDEIYDEPGLINMDPYGPGWLVVIAMDEEINSEELQQKSRMWRELRMHPLQPGRPQLH